MVTVVSTVPHPSVVKEAICRNCGATLNYVPADIHQRITTDYGGGCDTEYFITCPGKLCQRLELSVIRNKFACELQLAKKEALLNRVGESPFPRCTNT